MFVVGIQKTTKMSRGGFSKVVNSKRVEPDIEQIVHQHFFFSFSDRPLGRSKFFFERMIKEIWRMSMTDSRRGKVKGKVCHQNSLLKECQFEDNAF